MIANGLERCSKSFTITFLKILLDDKPYFMITCLIYMHTAKFDYLLKNLIPIDNVQLKQDLP